MPLEISEIGVHVAVGPEPAQAPSEPEEPSEPQASASGVLTPAQHEQIVAACVRQVLRSLRQTEER